MDKKNTAEIFAENLRNYRKALGLKQADLADKINYSVKAVSKWEKGDTLPPAQVILDICEVLGIEINVILDNTREASYYLGIDGGATKTSFVLADRSGTIISAVRLPSSNPFDIGFDRSTEILSRGIESVTRGISKRKISCFAGLSGGVSGNMRERFKEYFGDFGFFKAENGSDAENIIKAGLGDRDGAVIIMGTGSSCFAQKDGQLTRIGGYGYLFDGLGSGYDIGRDAIKYSLLDDNGVGEKTLLTQMIKEKTGCDTVLGNLSYFYSINKAGIASFCPLVFEAYEKGDGVAVRILDANMSRVAELINYAADIIGKKTDVVLVGGLTNQYGVLSPIIEEHLVNMRLSEKVSIRVYNDDVVYGALLNAGMSEADNFRVCYQ